MGNTLRKLKSRLIDLEGLGPVLFEQSRKAKRISISVRTGRAVRVAVPWGISFKAAEKLALTKRVWILKNIEKMRVNEENLLDQPLKLPEDQIKAILSEKTKIIGEINGFKFERVRVKSMSTRWGSCSGINNINLNIRLFLLPEFLQEYVILHELVHTQIKNHGTEFWAELTRVCQVKNAKILDKQLKIFQLPLC
ncbi:MAG: M48 family metallopeptidase [Candidatus Neomarinimicrobiota bacterium]